MRITSRTVADLRDRLTPNDNAVVETLDQVDIATAGQLRRLIWPDRSQTRTARRRLSQLADWRVVSRLERRVGGVRAGSDGYIYRLDVAGRRLLNQPPGRRPHTPGRMFLDHALAVTEIYVRVVEASRQHPVELVEFETEPTCWRSWATGVLKPDAYLITTTTEFEDHWFIEVDRATESTTTIARKAAVYERYFQTGIEQERHGLFPKVLWIVPSERRKQQLVETLSNRPAELWRLHQINLENETPNIFHQ